MFETDVLPRDIFIAHCPLCDAQMERFEDHITHPADDICPLSHMEIFGHELVKGWNRRAGREIRPAEDVRHAARAIVNRASRMMHRTLREAGAADLLRSVELDIASMKLATAGEEGPFCKPLHHGAHQTRKYLLRFADADRDDMHFNDEHEARLKWEAAEPSWNCELFATLPRHTHEE